MLPYPGETPHSSDPACALRSANQLFSVTRVRLETEGGGAFTVTAPQLWNNLLCQSDPAQWAL